jgi:hypothetical protein
VTTPVASGDAEAQNPGVVLGLWRDLVGWYRDDFIPLFRQAPIEALLVAVLTVFLFLFLIAFVTVTFGAIFIWIPLELWRADLAWAIPVVFAVPLAMAALWLVWRFAVWIFGSGIDDPPIWRRSRRV